MGPRGDGDVSNYNYTIFTLYTHTHIYLCLPCLGELPKQGILDDVFVRGGAAELFDESSDFWGGARRLNFISFPNPELHPN